MKDFLFLGMLTSWLPFTGRTFAGLPRTPSSSCWGTWRGWPSWPGSPTSWCSSARSWWSVSAPPSPTSSSPGHFWWVVEDRVYLESNCDNNAMIERNPRCFRAERCFIWNRAAHLELPPLAHRPHHPGRLPHLLLLLLSVRDGHRYSLSLLLARLRD